MEPVADLGGGAHPARAPPPLKLFCTIAPPPFWNVKKMFRNTEMCRISPPPPPPPVWDLRDSRRWWRSEKKGRNPPPPPPPPAYQSFFWDLRDFRGWRGGQKN